MSDLNPSGAATPRGGLDDDVHVGDLVRTGANAHPQFEVLAVKGDKAWVRDLSSGAEQIVPRHRVRRIDRSGR